MRFIAEILQGAPWLSVVFATQRWNILGVVIWLSSNVYLLSLYNAAL